MWPPFDPGAVLRIELPRPGSVSRWSDRHQQAQFVAVDAMGDPAVRARLADLGLQFPPREEQTPEALGAFRPDGDRTRLDHVPTANPARGAKSAASRRQDRAMTVAPQGATHARHEIRCCRVRQSSDAHSR
jgi:hypothetical protein